MGVTSRKAAILPGPVPRGLDRGRRRRSLRRRGRWWIAGIIEHVEEAGIHSGDSACVLPRMRSARRCWARSASRPRGSPGPSGWSGLLNVQFAIHGDERTARDRGQSACLADRSVRVQGDRAPLAKLACRVMLGEPIAALGLPREPPSGHVCVKEAVLRSTASRARTRCSARRCARPARRWGSPPTSRRRSPRPRPPPGPSSLTMAPCSSPSPTGTRRPPPGSRSRCTTSASRSSPPAGTAQMLRRMGIPTTEINKIGEGSPHVVDWIERGDVDLVINTPVGTGARADGYEIRSAAVTRGIPCITTMSGGMAAARRSRRPGAAPRRSSRCRRSTATDASPRPRDERDGRARDGAVRRPRGAGDRARAPMAPTACCAAPMRTAHGRRPGSSTC